MSSTAVAIVRECANNGSVDVVVRRILGDVLDVEHDVALRLIDLLSVVVENNVERLANQYEDEVLYSSVTVSFTDLYRTHPNSPDARLTLSSSSQMSPPTRQEEPRPLHNPGDDHEEMCIPRTRSDNRCLCLGHALEDEGRRWRYVVGHAQFSHVRKSGTVELQ